MAEAARRSGIRDQGRAFAACGSRSRIRGRGLPIYALAMKDGYTTGGGLGLGLSGAKRLSNEFDISSRVGEGTKVTIARWK